MSDDQPPQPSQTRRSWLKWIAVVPVTMLLLLGIYGVLAIRYWSDSPKLTHNFAAEYNARLKRTPEQDRAWPQYRVAIPNVLPLPEAELNPTRPDEQYWDEVEPWVASREGALAQVREASGLPYLGFAWSDAPTLEDARIEYPAAEPSELATPSENPAINSVLIIPLLQLRPLADALTYEMWVAAKQHNAIRVLEDAVAIIGIAEHARQLEFYVGDLSSLVIYDLAVNALGATLAGHPDLLDRDQLSAIQSRIEAFCDGDMNVRLSFAQNEFDDVLQRVYGKSGTFHIELARQQLDLGESSFPEKLLAPLTALRALSREDAVSGHDRLMEIARRHQRLNLWEIDEWPLSPELARCRGEKNLLVGVIAATQEDTDFMAETVTQLRDALLVAIALARFHQAQGNWPASLDELTPTFIKSIPPDRFDGRPVRYRLDDNDQPLLYSVGPDRDDDQGKLAVYHEHLATPDLDMLKSAQQSIADGDWRLWPEIVYAEEPVATDQSQDYSEQIDFPESFRLPEFLREAKD